ncbi:MAG: metallophosphatase family protein [Fuerstiella sp.]|nr:metallophosphatase family protein [Fuerstiella sp.]
MKLALFGGLYSNYLALEAAIADARSREVDEIVCLGDLGAFGPHPDRVFPLLRNHNIRCVQGNYDNSIGNQLDDCQCGYTDPRDNHFAQMSYEYTLKNTSDDNKVWLRDLPVEIRMVADGLKILLCHGSPRKTNEFLWESSTSNAFLDRLSAEYNADVIAGTHSGIRWARKLTDGRHFINVGVLGRPGNDGQTHVWSTIVRTGADADKDATVCRPSGPAVPVSIDFVPIRYNHHRLAKEMRAESLPAEFIETVLSGWWTTCLEILPSRERRAGRF